MIHPPKTLAEARKHRYNRWGGSPDGTSYREGDCAYEVHEQGRGGRFFQCSRKNGHGPAGLFCHQHDPETIKERDAERSRRYRRGIEQSRRAEDIGALRRAAELLSASNVLDKGLAAAACRALAKKKVATFEEQ